MFILGNLLSGDSIDFTQSILNKRFLGMIKNNFCEKNDGG